MALSNPRALVTREDRSSWVDRMPLGPLPGYSSRAPGTGHPRVPTDFGRPVKSSAPTPQHACACAAGARHTAAHSLESRALGRSVRLTPAHWDQTTHPASACLDEGGRAISISGHARGGPCHARSEGARARWLAHRGSHAAEASAHVCVGVYWRERASRTGASQVAGP